MLISVGIVSISAFEKDGDRLHFFDNKLIAGLPHLVSLRATARLNVY